MRAVLSGTRTVIVATFLLAWSAVAAGVRAEDVQPIVRADQAFTEAVTHGDKAAAAEWIDEQFEFTNSEGQTLNKEETLDQLSAITTTGPGATDVRSYNYREVGDVFGVHKQTRFLRIWVKRAAGWRVFNYIETSMGTRVPLSTRRGDCDNPCRTIPYTPTTAVDKAILDAWKHAKNDEWHPNSADWALRVSDEFLIINTGTTRTKPERVAILAKQQAAGEQGPPGDPIRQIRMFDFGDNAAIMLSLHDPYAGGRPYYNVRLWILRDNLWQLAVSQQTTISSAAPVPPAH